MLFIVPWKSWSRQDKTKCFLVQKLTWKRYTKVFFKQFSISRTFREDPNLFGTGKLLVRIFVNRFYCWSFKSEQSDFFFKTYHAPLEFLLSCFVPVLFTISPVTWFTALFTGNLFFCAFLGNMPFSRAFHILRVLIGYLGTEGVFDFNHYTTIDSAIFVLRACSIFMK